MGFYFRKSVKLGPMRLNFSKSGIGVSAGVKGARISAGPRGTYVHAGAGGFYYSQRIGGSSVRTTFTHPAPARRQAGWQPAAPALQEQYRIESADVSRLVETTNAELLEQINSAARQTRHAPFAVLATLLLSFFAFVAVAALTGALIAAGAPDDDTTKAVGAALAMFAGVAVLVAGVVFSWKVHKGDELKRTTPLFYELEQAALERFAAIQQACSALSQSARVWRVESKQPTYDWKRNAGASNLITRQTVSAGRMKPPHIATNVDVLGLRLNDSMLFFMPDFVFVWQHNRYGAVSYDAMGVSFSPTRFIEDAGVPQDAQVVDSTWQYVNKNGGPDRRFSNNRQIPVAQYGLLEIRSHTGLNIHLHVSNLEAARYFAGSFNHAQNASRGWHVGGGQQRRSNAGGPGSAPTSPRLRSGYEVLGVSVGASQAEVVAAYRQMAMMYHPDRLSGLAPEFVELAEERMKEINAAYEELKRHAAPV
jgi:hypothetical protein